jgi:hypothetical protein
MLLAYQKQAYEMGITAVTHRQDLRKDYITYGLFLPVRPPEWSKIYSGEIRKLVTLTG